MWSVGALAADVSINPCTWSLPKGKVVLRTMHSPFFLKTSFRASITLGSDSVLAANFAPFRCCVYRSRCLYRSYSFRRRSQRSNVYSLQFSLLAFERSRCCLHGRPQPLLLGLCQSIDSAVTSAVVVAFRLGISYHFLDGQPVYTVLFVVIAILMRLTLLSYSADMLRISLASMSKLASLFDTVQGASWMSVVSGPSGYDCILLPVQFHRDESSLSGIF